MTSFPRSSEHVTLPHATRLSNDAHESNSNDASDSNRRPPACKDNDGIVDYRADYTYTFQSNGKPDTLLLEQEGIVVTYGYDVEGHIEWMDVDYDATIFPTAADYTGAFTHTVVLGLIEESVADYSHGLVTYTEYDSCERWTVMETDYEGDGIIDHTQSSSYTYSGSTCTPVESVTVSGTTVITYTYDGSGRMIGYDDGIQTTTTVWSC